LSRPSAVILLLVFSGALAAQTVPPPAHHDIQDNSFLVEESYNQEEGVVQHINQFTRERGTGDWVATFTQEWPVGGIRHQLSYTIPAVRLDDGARKLADVALNYRYQLVGSGDTKLAIAPRLSVYLPTGSSRDGSGSGSVSWQTLVPVSWVVSPAWVVHANAGATYRPGQRDAEGDRATVWAWNVGASAIFTGSRLFDPLLEVVYSRDRVVIGAGRSSAQPVFLVSPGLRWAWNFRSGLQIVPGFAVPIGFGPSRGSRQVLVYLSFEHPFQKTN
jgi:hypothetical protein